MLLHGLEVLRFCVVGLLLFLGHRSWIAPSHRRPLYPSGPFDLQQPLGSGCPGAQVGEPPQVNQNSQLCRNAVALAFATFGLAKPDNRSLPSKCAGLNVNVKSHVHCALESYKELIPRSHSY